MSTGDSAPLPSSSSPTKAKPRRVRLPKYRLNKTTGRACVEINGHVHWLGVHGTPESKQKYDRLVAEWLASNRQAPVSAKKLADFTVNELVLRFWRHAEAFYRDADGVPTGEAENYRMALRPLKALYGFTVAGEFSPRSLKAVRQKMIEMGWTRRYINRQVGRLKHVFEWAVGEELIDPKVHQTLLAVKGLRKGKSEAREKPKVKKVPQEVVAAVLPHLCPTVRSMVELQTITGMRSGEVRSMRGCDIDTSDPNLWVYRPAKHKTEHHDIVREVYLGERCREIIGRHLKPDVQAYLFSPRDAAAWKSEKAKVHRRPNQKPNERKTARVVREKYDKDSYNRAIARGCDATFPPPPHLARLKVPGGRGGRLSRRETVAEWRRRLGPKQWEELQRWQAEHRWHSHRLRHTAASRLRKEFGLEAARVILGHTKGATTEIYAEQDVQRAREVMARVG